MTRHLDRQLAVRVTPELKAAIAADAADHGRTPAQSVRFLLRRSLELDPPPGWGACHGR